MNYMNAFWVGGIICAIGQILIDKTKLTPARILVSFVCIGVFLSLIGVYKPLVEFAGAGAIVPITGFGYALYNGVSKAITESGITGIIKGGLTATSAGITVAVISGLIVGLIFKPKAK